MQAGRLNRRCVIQAPRTDQDELGQPIPGWTDVATVWGDFRTLNGLESIKADATTATTQASARIRLREDLDTTMRVIVRSSVYAIVAVLPDENGLKFVDLKLEMRK